MNGPVGILGGTFDPVHVGHLRLALEVRERLGLAKVQLVPLHVPPHRAPPQASAALRLAMLQAVLDGPCGLHADDREVRRGGVSYTYDTLRDVRAEYPDLSLCLILGQDAFLNLPAWHRWSELLALAHLVVVGRPGSVHELPPILQTLADDKGTADPQLLRQAAAGSIYFLECPRLTISSSAIRAMIAAGRNPRFLVPDAALQLISQHNLYLTQTA